ncbi:unnamed protein product [Ceutorhynchus assimilis]|uniref:Uncharacterized protein n=1 Tax=Ceutorhynchus assimilis TaxID=467358 RepID=A0A9N9N292_9CUCU|nr:unnamed protein product [Ceutorhynchus assimilis]
MYRLIIYTLFIINLTSKVTSDTPDQLEVGVNILVTNTTLKVKILPTLSQDAIHIMNTNSEILNSKIRSLPVNTESEIDIDLSEVIKPGTKICESYYSDLKDQLRKTKENLCVLQIANGNIDKAINTFGEIKDNSKINDIVSFAYKDFGKINIIDNIIEFIKNLDSINEARIAYTVLFQLVKKDEPNNPISLSVWGEIENCVDCANVNNEYSLKTVNTWAYKIYNGSHQDVLDVATKYHLKFDQLLKTVIQKAYLYHSGDIKNIISFIKRLPYMSSTALGLQSLFNQMKISSGGLDNYGLIMLAQVVKETLDKVYPDASPILKDQLNNLKNGLPKSVKRLTWNGNNCTIVNANNNEFLYAAIDGLLYDKERRRVFTWPSPNIDVSGSWKIIPVDNGAYFTITSTTYNEYLYAVYDGLVLNAQNRRIFTWVPKNGMDNTGHWKLTPKNFGEYFTIESRQFNEYLYAGPSELAHDKERRNVFTWRPGGEVLLGNWKITC